MSTGPTGSYTVLARRFRPQGFSDVVGQEHVAQALRNAILSNRVAHAYLFTGARGVGKTSTARILARALNCPNVSDGNPCNECEICDGIAAGNDVDVLEIDGASNRGIDDIRQLRANVNVRSMRTPFKIYIIDEVHMLTKEAFNALLKTLEEPPPNVKFVFCTTEPNKVPDTILSRCQRFDFGTIGTSSIRDRLAHIAQVEGVQVDDEAMEIVARRAAGSMRDSQSIFDQLLAFGEEHVTAADVHRLLGTASDERLIAVGQALVGQDSAAALRCFHDALDDGVQLGELTDQLLFYLRDLMILASQAGNVELLAVGPDAKDSLEAQAARWGMPTILAAMQILSDTKSRMQRATYGRALAELALVRIAMLESLTNVDTLIESLRDTESAGVLSKSAQKKSDVAPSNPSPGVSQPATTTNAVQPSGDHDHRAQASSAASAPTETEESAQPEAAPELRATGPVVAVEPAPASETATAGETASDEAAAFAFQAENADSIWAQVISEINDMLKSHVKAVSKVAISAPNKLELSFPQRFQFSKKYCEKPEAISRLEQIASKLTGQQVRVSLVVSQDSGETRREATSGAATKAPGSAEARARSFREEDDEFVADVMNVFAAQVVRVDEIAVSPVGETDTDAIEPEMQAADEREGNDD